MRLPAAAVAALICCLPVAGCSGTDDDVVGAVRTYYEGIGRGDFEAACAQVEPSLREALSADGTPCATTLAAQYDTETKQAMTDTKVDAGRVQVRGDSASVPQDAVTFSGKVSTAGDLDLVKKDDAWFVAGGSG